jgi:formylglycine-generating enzyme
MKIGMRLTVALLSLATILPCAVSTAQEGATADLGLSKTKPTSGPFVEVDGQFMVPYTLTVPGTEVKIAMIPVPGGTFEMGSSKEDEAPVINVEVAPMWVAKTETTWREYLLYMEMYTAFTNLASSGKRMVTDENKADAVTAPTELYDATFTYKYGQDPDLPAVTMTQYAAKQYTKWLSKITGHQYRLPTESEWEFACRGGSKSAYCFGDQESALGDYAWYADNSEEKPHKVALKKPNAFGLHDMHGNVMEWTINQYTEDGYATLAGKGQAISAIDSVVWPKEIEGRALRGGSWQDFAPECRSSARFGSGVEDDWKEEDPNIPLSPWWFTNDPTRGVGFRIFRSYKPLDDKQIPKFWEIDNETIESDVGSRLRTGRGIQSAVDTKLPKEIAEQQK